MPLLPSNSYEVLDFYYNYFKKFRSSKNLDINRFIFAPRISNLVRIWYEQLDLRYLVVPYVHKIVIEPEETLSDISVFNRITKGQVKDWYDKVRDELVFSEDIFFHCHNAYGLLEINCQQSKKKCSEDEIQMGKGYYKICKECYRDGFFYKTFVQDLPGINGNLYQINEMITFMDLHLCFNSLSDILIKLMLGNDLIDESEKYNTFSFAYFYCHFCNRSLFDNFEMLPGQDELARSCLSCYVDKVYDDDVYTNEVLNHRIRNKMEKDRLGFVDSDILIRWINRQKVTKRLFTEDEIFSDWLDCKKPKREVPRLGILAARVLGNIFD